MTNVPNSNMGASHTPTAVKIARSPSDAPCLVSASHVILKERPSATIAAKMQDVMMPLSSSSAETIDTSEIIMK